MFWTPLMLFAIASDPILPNVLSFVNSSLKIRNTSLHLAFHMKRCEFSWFWMISDLGCN